MEIYSRFFSTFYFEIHRKLAKIISILNAYKPFPLGPPILIFCHIWGVCECLPLHLCMCIKHTVCICIYTYVHVVITKSFGNKLQISLTLPTPPHPAKNPKNFRHSPKNKSILLHDYQLYLTCNHDI